MRKKHLVRLDFDEIDKNDIFQLFGEMLERIGQGKQLDFDDRKFCIGALFGAMSVLQSNMLPTILTDETLNERLKTIAYGTSKRFAPEMKVDALNGKLP